MAITPIVTSFSPYASSLASTLSALIPSTAQLVGCASLWFLSEQWGQARAEPLHSNYSFSQLDPDGDEVFVPSRMLGDVLYEKNRYEEAALVYKKLLPEAQGCDKGQLLGRLGLIEGRKGNHSGSIELFEEVLELCPETDPFYVETLTRLAASYGNIQQLEVTQKLLNKGFELAEPGARKALLERDFDKALKLLDAGWEAMSFPEEYPLGGAIEFGRLLVAKSLVYIRMGKLTEALKCAKDAEKQFVELKQGEHPAQYTLFSTLSHMAQADIHCLNREDDQALKFYAQTLERLEETEHLTKSGEGGLKLYSESLNYDLLAMHSLCTRFIVEGKPALETYRSLLSLAEALSPSALVVNLSNTRSS